MRALLAGNLPRRHAFTPRTEHLAGLSSGHDPDRHISDLAATEGCCLMNGTRAARTIYPRPPRSCGAANHLASTSEGNMTTRPLVLSIAAALLAAPVGAASPGGE